MELTAASALTGFTADGAALGAVILGAVVGGAYPDVPTTCARMVRHGEVTEPSVENHAAYAKYVEQYRSLYPLLAPQFDALVQI